MQERLSYIGLGANLGDRVANCLSALKLLDASEGCSVIRRSGWYETEPVGMESSNLFINAVAELVTTLEPELLMNLLLEVEKELGRQRGEGVADRTVDLDLLFMEGVVVGYPADFVCEPTVVAGADLALPDKEQGLVIPHPAISKRRFVLEPWAEIAPDLFVEPWSMTVSEMLAALA